MPSNEHILDYLKEDRRVASLDVDKYAGAITEQNKQMNTSMGLFMKMFEGLSKDVKELAVKVEENTRVTTEFGAQRDTLTACLVEIRSEMKDTQKSVVALELAQARGEERQRAGKEYSVEGLGWLKWVLGGAIVAAITVAARLITS